MFYALSLAKQAMTDSQLRDAINMEKKAIKLEEAGETDTSILGSSHKPNILNTVVFLVETAQQVAVMLVNYKGRPWMRGATENPGLLYSLAACTAGIVIAAWELVPQVNSMLGLVTLPSDEMRYQLLTMLGVTLVGSLLWDRLCLAIFAPAIFKSQLSELASLRLSDFWGPNAPKIMVGGAVAAIWLFFFEGNIILAIGGYWMYKRFTAPPAAAQ